MNIRAVCIVVAVVASGTHGCCDDDPPPEHSTVPLPRPGKCGCTPRNVLKVGDDCLGRYDCDHCQVTLVCNVATSQCEEPHVNGVGQPCGADENCAAPLTCGLGAVCDLSGQVAAFCDQDADCMTGLVCNTGYTPDECHPPGVAGARCGGRPEECEVGLTCDATVVPYVCR